MSVVALSGSDSVIINNRSIVNLADSDCVTLDFPNDIANAKIGKNGNAIYGLNQMGNLAEVKLRVIRGSSDDSFLNNLIAQQNANFAGTVLMIGEFIKQIGDGAGNIKSDTYILAGGIMQKMIPAKSNVEGDTEQSVSIYMMKFTNAPRVIT